MHLPYRNCTAPIVILKVLIFCIDNCKKKNVKYIRCIKNVLSRLIVFIGHTKLNSSCSLSTCYYPLPCSLNSPTYVMLIVGSMCTGYNDEILNNRDTK